MENPLLEPEVAGVEARAMRMNLTGAGGVGPVGEEGLMHAFPWQSCSSSGSPGVGCFWTQFSSPSSSHASHGHGHGSSSVGGSLEEEDRELELELELELDLELAAAGRSFRLLPLHTLHRDMDMVLPQWAVRWRRKRSCCWS